MMLTLDAAASINFRLRASSIGGAGSYLKFDLGLSHKKPLAVYRIGPQKAPPIDVAQTGNLRNLRPISCALKSIC